MKNRCLRNLEVSRIITYLQINKYKIFANSPYSGKTYKVHFNQVTKVDVTNDGTNQYGMPPNLMY